MNTNRKQIIDSAYEALEILEKHNGRLSHRQFIDKYPILKEEVNHLFEQGKLGYQGWANYDTWLFSLHMDNDEYLYNEYIDYLNKKVKEDETIKTNSHDYKKKLAKIVTFLSSDYKHEVKRSASYVGDKIDLRKVNIREVAVSILDERILNIESEREAMKRDKLIDKKFRSSLLPNVTIKKHYRGVYSFDVIGNGLSIECNVYRTCFSVTVYKSNEVVTNQIFNENIRSKDIQELQELLDTINMIANLDLDKE